MKKPIKNGLLAFCAVFAGIVMLGFVAELVIEIARFFARFGLWGVTIFTGLIIGTLVAFICAKYSFDTNE